jgi:hypothetical protein
MLGEEGLRGFFAFELEVVLQGLSRSGLGV